MPAMDELGSLIADMACSYKVKLCQNTEKFITEKSSRGFLRHSVYQFIFKQLYWDEPIPACRRNL